MFNFKILDILWAWIEHPSEKLWPFEFLESFRCSFSSVSIYHGPHTYTRVKSYGRLNFMKASVFNFDCLDILFTWIGHPSEMLKPFKFFESFRSSFSSVSIYHGPHTYTQFQSYGRLNLPRASVLNFDRLNILCAGIRDPIEILCTISRVSIYYEPESDIIVKSYDQLNFSRASVVHFRAARYIMGLTHTPESKVMFVWICQELLCSISTVSIYYAPESKIRVKCYYHLNFSRAFPVHFQTSRNIMRLTHTPESKVMAV